MAAYVRTEMPIPTRSAPRPPSNFGSQNNTAWSNNDPFESTSTMQPIQKKKPPPRPPPPRFKKDYASRQDDRTKKPTRPTELLGNLFGRKSHQKQENHNPAYTFNRPQNSNSQMNPPDVGVSLIDLSPPGSPTFTTRSSSDGVSVDSFGSDGNSNPSMFTSSGNTSQTESAFEDDFDFFGSITSSKRTENDSWKVTASQDPFSPLPSNSSIATKRVGDASFFAYNDTTTNNQIAGNFTTTNNLRTTMPTIIRARPPKPPAPKTLRSNLAPIVTDFNAPAISSVSSNYNVPSSDSGQNSFDTMNDWSANFNDNSSLPMPSIPPPALPSEHLWENDNSAKSTNTLPHGIALYDYAASQSDDLALKQGETVTLVRAINDEWLEGRIGNRTGMFPANFVDVVVPLQTASSSNVVNALYTFTGETWEDLPFEEGSKITVLSRISDDWLYGDCRGKKGQFPANYVDRVPEEFTKKS